MQIIVTVTERYKATREVIGQDLSGDYVIHVPDGKEAEAATQAAIQICKESLALEDTTWFTFSGRLAE
jgi:predicted RNase H-like HicB family nuclease